MGQNTRPHKLVRIKVPAVRDLYGSSPGTHEGAEPNARRAPPLNPMLVGIWGRVGRRLLRLDEPQLIMLFYGGIDNL
jgi:hypothetical protein